MCLKFFHFWKCQKYFVFLQEKVMTDFDLGNSFGFDKKSVDFNFETFDSDFMFDMNFKYQSKTSKYDEGKDEDGNFDLSDKLLKKFKEKNFQIIKKVSEIGLPKNNEQIRLITTKPFNTISIISFIAENEIIEEATFVIFAINKYAAKIIIELFLSGRIKKVNLIVSSIRNAGHVSKSKAVDMLKQYFDIVFVNSHAKITILKTEEGNSYNIEGSGNFSFNGRLEQYVIDNDVEIYNFSKEWIKEILKYKMK